MGKFYNLTPKEIVAELDKYIIGQESAKKSVAIALRNRHRRNQLSDEMREEVTPKNILMVGPTGCGKTEIARRLAKIMEAPFAEKETSCKYYFIDNGVLDLFLLDGETMLLENIVALALFRKYGHDSDNERVFFYNNKVEVDFYVTDERLPKRWLFR